MTTLRLWLAPVLGLVAASCGSDLREEADADAGPDPNEIVVASVTRCTEARPPALTPELPLEGHRQAFFSKHPVAQVQHQGGSILPSPRIIGIFFRGDTMQKATEALLQSYGCTSYWRDAVNEYGVGDAIYDKSLILDEVPTASNATSLEALQQWILVEAEDALGNLSDQHILLFFLPAKVRLESRDCTGVLGIHTMGYLGRGLRRIPFAYISMCSDDASPRELATRAHSATHELIEMATDPYPFDDTAWKGLGIGVTAPSIRPSSPPVNGWVSDDEGADFCNVRPARAPDYPFAIARNYSNRLARSGKDPCDPIEPIGPLAALDGEPSVDLSSGRAHIVLDISGEDPSTPLTLDAQAQLSGGNGALLLRLLDDSTLIVHDGETVPLDLSLSLPASFASNIAAATQYEVIIQLCPSGSYEGCASSRFPISRLPPIEEAPDAGVQDAGPDAG